MNFEALTQELSDLYTGLKNGKIKPETAHELNNTAANIQANIRLGLFNCRLRNEVPDLTFFKKPVPKAKTKTPVKKAARHG